MNYVGIDIHNSDIRREQAATVSVQPKTSRAGGCGAPG